MTSDVKAAFPAGVVATDVMHNGHAYSVPTNIDGMLLFVNKKIFSDAGLSYPTDKASFISDAKALTKNGVYGYGSAEGLGGMLSNEILRWVGAFGGDAYKLTNNAGAKQALQFMYDCLYKYKITPTSVIADSYDQMNQKMADGKYAMIYQWGYLYSVIGPDKFSAGFDVAPVPTFANNHTISGGWMYTLNSYSKNQDAAKKVLAYLATANGQKLLLDSQNASSGRTDVINDQATVAKNPVLGFFGKYATAGSLVPRPVVNNVGTVATSVEAVVQKYLTKSITLDQCITQAQKVIDTQTKAGQ
jgi:multiple sugar transport system substrate-binding protein